ncbi:hypothetical protein SAMN02910358_02628 [Lachnospiraceae bacterium XBB1006]|nr:hypothetical protein SAMN02910358_02621 [Lachnospiraceae bacterium XBB1006]SFQ52227.1 hypothetical protein SAMN02910358_02628 [Lachnospiraceae bacterium XBB1006]
MRKKLLLFIIYGFIFISFFYGFNPQELREKGEHIEKTEG